MRVKSIVSILFIIGALFIISCTSEPVEEQGKPVIYIVSAVEEPKVKTYVVGEINELSWYEETKQERFNQNLRRNIDEDEDEQGEFEIKSKYKNVVRSVDGELIVGYEKELDNPEFEEVDS